MHRGFSRAAVLHRHKALVMAAALLLACLTVPGVNAQTRVFTTCAALEQGFDSSVVEDEEATLSSFCRAQPGSAQVEATTFRAAVVTTPPEPAADPADAAVTTSSFDEMLISVVGGSETEGGGADTRAAGQPQTESTGPPPTTDEDLTTLPNPDRPDGPWAALSAVAVMTPPAVIWKRFSDITNFFIISLAGLGTTITRESEKVVRVEFEGSGGLSFVEVDRSEEERFLIFELEDIDETVFPGFDLEGTEIYTQVLNRPGSPDTAEVEVGWGSNSTDLGGDTTIGLRQLESLILEMTLNIGREFGLICDDAVNVRTIEGDCNNLDIPEQGVAGGALRRLGGGLDPAYPGGNRSIPAGPLDVNVRNVSNGLLAMSPGAIILEPQLEDLRKTCINGTTGSAKFLLCPLSFVVIPKEYHHPIKVPFVGIEVNDCEEIELQYKLGSCEINIRLKCSGETVLDLAEDPCGADTNRLFSPVGCVIIPGEDAVLANSDGLTDLFFSFGQFLDHDIGLSPLSQVNEQQPGFSRLSRGPPPPDVDDDFPIDIPDNDFHFDREEFEFTRATFSADDTDSQVNVHSSYLDGSQIYGVNFRRSRLLRSFVGGRLALSDGDLPPFNGFGEDGSLGATVENGPNIGEEFFVVGDVRGNEQTLLLCLHIIFLREHNRVADELAAAFPEEQDDETLYQTARAIVIAEFQCIVYQEWLPLLLGPDAPAAGDFSYDPGLDVTASAIFTTAAFRFGHSMVGTNLLKMGPGPASTADMDLLPIRDAFFGPDLVIDNGIELFLRGGARHLCKEMDNKIVDELRNFLIIDFDLNVTVPLRFDLMSLNLQRGRDMGLPSLNDVRELFGLPRYKNFSEFIKDPNVADLAEDIYGDVDVVDTFFGGVVEEHVPGSQLGETFNTIVKEQFVRFRDADRFFYTSLGFGELADKIPVVQEIIDGEVRLADVIVRNSDVEASELGMKDSVFQV